MKTNYGDIIDYYTDFDNNKKISEYRKYLVNKYIFQYIDNHQNKSKKILDTHIPESEIFKSLFT